MLRNIQPKKEKGESRLPLMSTTLVFYNVIFLASNVSNRIESRVGVIHGIFYIKLSKIHILMRRGARLHQTKFTLH